jgi:hypothetical protein
MSLVNKFMTDMCTEIANNFNGKEFTVNDLMEHFNAGNPDSSESDDESKPKKKTKKEKKPKDPNAPKKPTNSYMYYSQHIRKTAEEGTKYGAKQLGQMWKEVDSDTKSTFEEMGKKDNDRYQKEKAEYESAK